MALAIWNTGDADNATDNNKKDVSFQQIALGMETVSENLDFMAMPQFLLETLRSN